MHSLKELNLKDKRVLMRVDFNVPLKGTDATHVLGSRTQGACIRDTGVQEQRKS